MMGTEPGTVVADLHTHTTATDGRATAETVIMDAARAGLRYLTITDHSVVTFDGLATFAARHGVTIPFPGAEVSTYHGHRKHHILVYGTGLLEPRFQQYLSMPNDAKTRVADATRQALVDAGHDLPALDTIRRNANGPGQPTPEKRVVSRSAIARHLMVSSGLTTEDARDRVVTTYQRVDEVDRDGRDRLAARYLPTLQVIREATDRGLFTSLAHPLWECRSTADVLALCDEVRTMRDCGLGAMESRSYHHRRWDDHPALLSTRQRLGLLSSGGSDYHANGKTTLGVGGLPEDAFLELAAQVPGACTDV